MLNAGIIWGGGDCEGFAHFFAEALTENDIMGEKLSPKYGKNNI